MLAQADTVLLGTENILVVTEHKKEYAGEYLTGTESIFVYLPPILCGPPGLGGIAGILQVHY